MTANPKPAATKPPSSAKPAPTPETAGEKQKKHRSPNYPAFSLEHAVQKATTLYQANKRHWVPMAAALKLMEYKAESSTGQQAVGALKAFGLVDDQGSGDKRQVQVSERAMKIILGHPQKAQLLREAALSPAMNAEVWGKFYDSDNGLAPDETIKYYLIFDREVKFNPEAVGQFLAQLKNTARFAGLDSSPIISGQPSEDREIEPPENAVTTSTTIPNKPAAVVQHVPGDLPLPIPQPDGSFRVVMIPCMDSITFDFFKSQLEVYKPIIVKNKVEPKPE